MTIVEPRIPSGFPEYLPAEQLEFNRLLGIIRRVYELHGFIPLDTVDIELADVLLAKGGGETDKQVYELTKGDTRMALRFDHTVPLARYVAEHEGELVFPFRRYAIGKVHRGERAQAGRFREFYQCDIDVIGSESPLVDAEFPAIINDIFTEFNFGEFTIRINDRRVLNGFFEGLGLAENATDILRVIDKMEKVELTETQESLAKLGLNDEQIQTVLTFVAIEGTPESVLQQLEALNVTSEKMTEGINSLRTLIGALLRMGVPAKRFTIDMKIVRGLDYYTGTVYETVLNDHPEVGSVCSGGRFDNLAEYYTKTHLPGVGISIGLTRLFYKLLQAGIIQPTQHTPAQVLILPMGEDHVDYALSIKAELVQTGIATELYTEPNAMKKKMRYADRMGFPHVVIIGDQEVSDNTVTVKNMRAEGGPSHTVVRSELVTSIQPAQ